MTVAERQGYEGGRLGVLLSSCPYADGVARADWRRGWLRAEADADAENVTRQFREPRP